MVMPYLVYQGNCEEAFEHYAAVFGGKIEGISRFTEATGGAQLAGRVMHAFVSLKNGGISGADQLEPVNHGAAMQLLVHCGNAREAGRIMRGLAEGGQTLSELTPHPPPDDTGMGGLVKDKYGYIWIIAAPNREV